MSKELAQRPIQTISVCRMIAAVRQATPPTIFRITGGKTRTLKSGPRKGKLTVEPGTSIEVYVTRAELLAEEQAYEDETGKCRACVGGGLGSAKCKRCSGTGRVELRKVAT